MTGTLNHLWHDRAGSPSVDLALTLPILLMMTVGVLQLGIAFLANSGIRNGVEAGARYATVITSPISKTYPTDSDIWTNIQGKLFGLSPLGTATSSTNPTECGTKTGTKYSGTVTGTSDSYSFVICHGTSGTLNYVDVTGNYPVRMNLGITTTPKFNITYTRRAYQL